MPTASSVGSGVVNLKTREVEAFETFLEGARREIDFLALMNEFFPVSANLPEMRKVHQMTTAREASDLVDLLPERARLVHSYNGVVNRKTEAEEIRMSFGELDCCLK
jgi:hypothetical protein